MLLIEIFLIAFISSFIGILIPGIASALSVSSLILLGIPIQIAKTTYQIGNLGINVGALIPLIKTQKIRRNIIIPLFFIAGISGFIGGNILISLPTNILLKLTGAFMMGLLVINMFSKSLGLISKEISHTRRYTGFILYFIINLIFSIFPMGIGVLYQFLHTSVFRVTNLEGRLIGCITTIPFVLCFIVPIFQSGFYNIQHITVFTIGGYLGGYLGAKSGIKIGNSMLKKLLTGWLFCIGTYFLFFA